MSVKASAADHSGIECPRSVGSSDKKEHLVGLGLLESVNKSEERSDKACSFCIGAACGIRALSRDRVKFVKEDDRSLMLSRILKELIKLL